MADYKVISSDSHVVEPPDIWVERMDRAKFGNRIPHMVPAGDIDAWMVDNKETGGVGSIAQAGFRFDRPDEIVLKGSFDDVRPGGYIPSEHVKDMDIDGVHGGLVYPSIGLALYRDVEDPDLARGIFAAYNDWLAEFCNAYPERLKGAAMILVDEDVDLAIEETQRVADLGIKTVMISSYPRADRTYDNPIYEPYWTMAEENDITVNLHVTTNRPKADPITRGVSTTSTASYVQHDYWVRMSLCHMIFSGVFERHPNLKVAEVEHELGWLPYFIGRIDIAYEEKQESLAMRFKDGMMPSDFMRRNVYHSFQEDALGIQMRHVIGVENLMWGSDYPHSESTFPKSLEILDSILEGVPEEEKAMIVGENAARVYGF